MLSYNVFASMILADFSILIIHGITERYLPTSKSCKTKCLYRNTDYDIV